jgi:hypothetical protein
MKNGSVCIWNLSVNAKKLNFVTTKKIYVAPHLILTRQECSQLSLTAEYAKESQSLLT